VAAKNSLAGRRRKNTNAKNNGVQKNGQQNSLIAKDGSGSAHASINSNRNNTNRTGTRYLLLPFKHVIYISALRFERMGFE
jgi:hypothetical protein